MMKKLLVFSLLASTLFTACDPDWYDCDDPIGPERVFVYDVPDIDELYNDCNLDVVVFKSNNPRIEVVAADNIIHNVDVIIRGTTVNIDHSGCVRPRDVRVEVYTRGLSFVEINGSGDLDFRDYNDVRQATLKIDGSGDMFYMGDSRELKCIIDGSGDLVMAGSTEEMEIIIDGSGDIEAFDMRSEDAYVHVDGSGDSEIWVEDELYVDIDGSGDVYYIGFPDIHLRGRGSGRLIERN